MNLERDLFYLALKGKNKMRYCKVLIFLLVFLLLNKQLVFAESSHQFIKRTEWVKYAKTYDYSEHFKTTKEAKKSTPKKHMEMPSFFSGLPIFVYLLVIVLIIVIIALIVILILGLVKQSNETLSKTSPYRVSTYENIENADLDTDLQHLLSLGLYKEALRIRYLIVLKTLNKNRLVIWKMDKTNGNYLQEMHGKKGFDIFRKLTISFERAWYGDMQITEKEYLHIIPVFDQIYTIAEQ